MKYKQRLVTAVVGVVVLLCVVIYSGTQSLLSRSPKGGGLDGFVADLTHGRFVSAAARTCDSMKATATYMVDDFYDKVRFRKNNDNGLYIVNETESAYADPHNKKIMQSSEPLTVIVVPHSHNDPGWLWTLQTYYEVRTKHIISNAVKFLKETPDFRMIWSETIFLKMWWEEASEQDREQLKSLLVNGQLEILSGGWVSVDEATTHYTAVLDQLIEGHLWIKDNLGITVNTSWSIDPFGYSLTLPYLWKKSGMSNMAILRIHGAVKSYMGNRQLLTYDWRQPWDVSGVHDITCHVEPFTLYNIEYSCGPNMDICKRMDFAREPDFPPEDGQPRAFQHGGVQQNFEQLAKSIVEQYRLKASQYSHNVILMPHGDDFRYVSDYEWQRQYANMKRLISFVNSKQEWNVQMKFGTVGEYFDILKNQIKRSKLNGKPEPVITGDYFTYTDRDHEYWSGYYTTRPFDKRMIRSLLELLKVTEVVTSYAIAHSQQHGHVFVGLPEALGALQNARRTHGLVQHHDAITGTSAHATVLDFEKRVFDAISKLQQVTAKSLHQLLFTSPPGSLIEPLYIQSSPDSRLASKVLKLSESGSTLIFINGYTQRRKEIQSIIVNTPDVEIIDENGKSISVQVNPVFAENSMSSASVTGTFIILKPYQVYFELSIAPLSCVTYTVKKSASQQRISSMVSVYNGNLHLPPSPAFDVQEHMGNISELIKIENPHFVAEFSSFNGTLQRLCKKNAKSGNCANLRLGWVKYQTGNSNAYTLGTEIKAIQNLLEVKQKFVVVSGKILTQVRISHTDFQQVVAFYHTQDIQGKAVHIDNIATLNPDNNPDAELMMRLETDVVNEHGRYFTDSNGFQLVNRRYRSELPIGANFYPITSMAVLEDKSRRLTLHVAQPHGAASLRDGHLDVMMERIPMSKGKGLEEAVLDQKPAPSKMLLTLEHASSPRPPQRDNKDFVEFPSLTANVINDLLQNPVQVFTIAHAQSAIVPRLMMVSRTLPSDVIFSNIKTLMTERMAFLGTGVTLHRRKSSCVFSDSEGASANKAPINLKTIFNNVEIDQLEKRSLTHVHLETQLSEQQNIHLEPGEMDSYSFKWK